VNRKEEENKMKRVNRLVAGIMVIAVSLLLAASLSYDAPAKMITWKAQNNYPGMLTGWTAEATARAIETAMPFYDDLAKISPEARKMIDIIRKQMKDVGELQQKKNEICYSSPAPCRG
jgi:hypothetical protein